MILLLPCLLFLATVVGVALIKVIISFLEVKGVLNVGLFVRDLYNTCKMYQTGVVTVTSYSQNSSGSLALVKSSVTADFGAA